MEGGGGRHAGLLRDLTRGHLVLIEGQAAVAERAVHVNLHFTVFALFRIVDADAAAEILIQSDAGPTALLYGREDKGLPNEALDLCHRVVTIPTNPAYPSLNLAHAVVLMLYELALARGDDARPFKAPRREGGPVTVDDLERLFADAEAALRGIEFFKTREVEGVMRTLREVMHRTPLDQREAKLLRAMAIEVVKYSERLARSRLHVDG